jgi:type I restriction enzyme, S subunit
MARARDVPHRWRTLPVLECVRSETPIAKVPRKDYHSQGPIPVIDQGQGLIGGYVNDQSLAERRFLPVIVFGDHTRHWKYVDFPFAVGADGTKLFVPRGEELDARFLYYALSTLPLKDLGYSRHFKLLKELFLLIPPLNEQRKIAAILSATDEVIEKTEAVIERLQTLKKALMQELLTRGLPGRHTRFKQTEIGEIPEGWEVSALDALIEPGRPICYGILMPGKGHPGGVPVIKVKNIKGGVIEQTDLLLTTPEIDAQYARARVRPGDVLLTIRGTTGRVARVPDELANANITQDTARLSIRNGVSSDYMFHALQSSSSQIQIRDHTRGQAVKGINIGDVRKLLVPIPKLDEQTAIADTFEALDQAVLCTDAERKALRAIKAALMSVLLTGELRVTPAEGAA